MTGEALDPIRRPFTPADLAPLLVAAGVDATVLVQTVPSVAETREFLGTAAATSFVAGVVGWVDLSDPAVAATLAELKESPGGERLVGIRHQVHDEDDADWLLRPEVWRGLAAVRDAGLAYDILVRPRELPAALATARAFPDMRFVIDHLAKPPIASGQIAPWAALMAPFRELPYVSCKLSGMATEADWRTWTADDLRPYVQRALGHLRRRPRHVRLRLAGLAAGRGLWPGESGAGSGAAAPLGGGSGQSLRRQRDRVLWAGRGLSDRQGLGDEWVPLRWPALCVFLPRLAMGERGDALSRSGDRIADVLAIASARLPHRAAAHYPSPRIASRRMQRSGRLPLERALAGIT